MYQYFLARIAHVKSRLKISQLKFMQSQIINKQEIIRASDECVMCGLCLPHCPTYRIAQVEAESPRGRIALIRALYENQLKPDKSLHKHLNNCLSCMKCEQVCPANVDYEKIIDAGRAISKPQQNLAEKAQQSFVLLVLSQNLLRKTLKTLLSIVQYFGLLRILPKLRLFSLATNQNSTRFSTFKSDVTNGPKICVISSCANDFLNDPTQSAATAILSKLNCEVTEPNSIPCCGALHQHTGNLKKSNNLRDEFIDAYKGKDFDYLVTVTTGCGAQIKQFEDALSLKVIDINDFLLTQLETANLAFNPLAKKVFIQSPCTQMHVTSEKNLIPRLLSVIPDIELLHFDDQTGCCGAGGINSLTNAKLANQLIDSKIDELKKYKNAILVSSNIGCALHFQARLKQENIPIQVRHPVTLLAEQMI